MYNTRGLEYGHIIAIHVYCNMATHGVLECQCGSMLYCKIHMYTVYRYIQYHGIPVLNTMEYTPEYTCTPRVYENRTCMTHTHTDI